MNAAPQAFKMAASGSNVSTARTDRDIPLPLCCAILLACILPFYVVISLFMDDWLYTILLSFFVVVFGFFASAIAAYMAGRCCLQVMFFESVIVCLFY